MRLKQSQQVVYDAEIDNSCKEFIAICLVAGMTHPQGKLSEIVIYEDEFFEDILMHGKWLWINLV